MKLHPVPFSIASVLLFFMMIAAQIIGDRISAKTCACATIMALAAFATIVQSHKP